MEYIFYANTNQKEADVAKLIKAKPFGGDKQDHWMMIQCLAVQIIILDL